MPSTGTLGGTLPWGPKSLKVKRQAYPHDGSRGLKQPTPASHLSQITITGLESRVQLDVAGRSENFLVDTGATYSVLISYSGAFSSQTCTILGATGKTITNDSSKDFFVAGMDKYLPSSFWWYLDTPLLGRDLFLPSNSCSYCHPDRRCSCIPVADSFWYLEKLIQLCTVYK